MKKDIDKVQMSYLFSCACHSHLIRGSGSEHFLLEMIANQNIQMLAIEPLTWAYECSHQDSIELVMPVIFALVFF